MNKTLKISFSLKNTYRVNGILFSLKQIPLLKRLLPATLYQVKGLKIFANILSVLWEIVSTFIGKFLYFITMVCGKMCIRDSGNRKKYCEKCAGIAYKRQQAEYARKKRTESKNRG